MKQQLRHIWPRYTVLPLLAILALNTVTFTGTKFLLDGRTMLDLTTPLDLVIPLVPFFILIYCLAFPQWVIGYTVIAREDEDTCYRVLGGEIIAKLMCLVLFLTVPMTMQRPEVPQGGFWNFWLRFVYWIDSPTNLFPSIHCLESWLVFRGALRLKKPPRWYKWAMLPLSLAIFASTLLVKQHVIADVLAGILVAELGQLLAKPLRVDRLLAAANRRFCKVK